MLLLSRKACHNLRQEHEGASPPPISSPQTMSTRHPHGMSTRHDLRLAANDPRQHACRRRAVARGVVPPMPSSGGADHKRANQLTKGWAKGGDILLTHNATVGRVACVEPSIGSFLLGTSVTFSRVGASVVAAASECIPAGGARVGFLGRRSARGRDWIELPTLQARPLILVFVPGDPERRPLAGSRGSAIVRPAHGVHAH
jgi:hypothetical protein